MCFRCLVPILYVCDFFWRISIRPASICSSSASFRLRRFQYQCWSVLVFGLDLFDNKYPVCTHSVSICYKTSADIWLKNHKTAGWHETPIHGPSVTNGKTRSLTVISFAGRANNLCNARNAVPTSSFAWNAVKHVCTIRSPCLFSPVSFRLCPAFRGKTNGNGGWIRGKCFIVYTFAVHKWM